MAEGLRDIYGKHMRHHGCGMAMYQPIAHKDIEPPCCGYFDEKGKWNLIAKLRSQGMPSEFDLTPLHREPTKMRQVGLRWQPKCSKGVRMYNVDLLGKTPAFGIPVGADAHIKYQSKKSFGAVLIAHNPVEVTAYNDEALFKEWIENNKPQLYDSFGHQLKKYGFWVITTTYTAPGCSINAWMKKDENAVLSAKAKAAMAGDFGMELDWTDKITDKDWCHYTAKPNNTMFNLKANARDPYTQAIRSTGRKSHSKSRSPQPKAATEEAHTMTTPRRRETQASNQNPNVAPARSLSRKRAFSPDDSHVRVSKLNIETSYIADSNHSREQGNAVSPLSTTTEKIDHSAFSEANPASPVQQTAPKEPLVSEGVVMFYDGHYAHQLEWWVEGAKGIAVSVLGSKQPRHGIDNSKSTHTNSWKNDAVEYNAWDQGQRTIVKEIPDHRDSITDTKPLRDARDDVDEDYYPEHDDGVHPRYWPSRNPSFRARTNAGNRVSLAGANGMRTVPSPGYVQNLDERHPCYSVSHESRILYPG